ncbi:FKBP-type peptidyl-prolyl cis-trans isomerase [Candidatus Gracilibacteria bacterium]|nr:FKBP-type peptidyl-prolyl cis-trans isomerase [Candidatus Gracilibacteria bacterium]
MKKFIFVLALTPFLFACTMNKSTIPKDVTELQINTLQEGAGEAVKAGDNVSVHYVGTFTDGTEFDSSRGHGVPFHFTAGGGQVIQGWDEGVLGMKIGELRQLIIPPSLGYGENDYGPIPGGSTLVFEVELLEIK